MFVHCLPLIIYVFGLYELLVFSNIVLQVHKFLDKNFDMVRLDVVDLFIKSKNKVRNALIFFIL